MQVRGRQRYHSQQQRGGGFDDGFGMGMGGFRGFGGGGLSAHMNAMMNIQSNFPPHGGLHNNQNGGGREEEMEKGAAHKRKYQYVHSHHQRKRRRILMERWRGR